MESSMQAKLLFTGSIEYSDNLEKVKAGQDFISSFQPMTPYFQHFDCVVGFTKNKVPSSFQKVLDTAGFHKVLNVEDKLTSSVLNADGINIGVITIDATQFTEDSIDTLREDLIRLCQEMRSHNTDFIIAYVNWDSSSSFDTTKKQRLFAHALSALDIDLILGTNDNCIQPVSYFPQIDDEVAKPVFYSLGTFLTTRTTRKQKTSFAVSLLITKDTAGKINYEFHYQPCYIFEKYDGIKLLITPINGKKYPSGRTNQLMKEQHLLVESVIGKETISTSPDFIPADNNKLPDDYLYPVEYAKSIFDEDFSMNTDHIFNGTIYMEPSTDLQRNIFDTFKTTDAFKRSYGEYIIANRPQGDAVKGAIRNIQRFKGVENVSISEYKDLIIDLLYMRNIFGFYHLEYFCYGFEHKSLQERLEFMSERSLNYYFGKLNNDRKAVALLKDKYQSYLRFKEFYDRDVIMINGPDDKEVFTDFIEKHPKFIAKPNAGLQGKGIRIVSLDEYENGDAMFDALMQNGSTICEELIVQSESMKNIHENSVNSVRIFTYYNGADAKPILGWLKAGRGGAVVDNGGAGGLIAALDINTGVVTTDGWNERGDSYKLHPDTQFTFQGFKVERWKELCDLASKAAKAIPELHIVGWDMALSDDGWKIIEGNAWGGIFVQQFATQKGVLKTFLEECEWYRYKDL